MISSTGATFPLRFTGEQLAIVTADVLKLMNRLWGGRGNEPKDNCIRNILNGLADENAVRAALSVLTPEERTALAILKEYGGVIQVELLVELLLSYGYAVDHESTVNFGFGGAGSHFVANLLRRGFLLLTPRLVTGYSPYSNVKYSGLSTGESVYIDERFLAQIDWSVEVRPLSITPASTIPPGLNVRRPQLVLLDLLAVMRVLAEMKQFSLTKSGAIRVAELRKFQQRMNWKDQQTFDGYPFPHIAQAVMLAWEHAGWLRVTGEDLIVALTPESFAQQPLIQQIRHLSNGFISTAEWSEEPDDAFDDILPIQSACSAFVHSLQALPDLEQYYTVPDFLTALYDRVGDLVVTQLDFKHYKPVPYNKSEQAYREELASWERERLPRWVARETAFAEAVLTSWMYWLGLVEVGRLADQTLAFRLTELGRALLTRTEVMPTEPITPAAATPWVVQPNYDIVVYLDAISPAQLAFLEQHAERRQAEAHTAHYQLTRDSIYRALESGATLDSILTTLRLGSQADLPQNVERELREWAGQREQLTLRTKAKLIAFPSAETRALALEAGLHGTPVGETYVLVETETETQIRATLKAVFGLQSIPVIDYLNAPLPSLNAEEDGMLTQQRETGDLLLHGQLARCAEPVDATRWRITPASLTKARQAGVSAGILLAFLNSRVTSPVPAVLEIVISNALGTRDVVQGDTAFVLRITNKKLHSVIATNARFKPYLLDVPGPDTILINQAHLEEFKAQLAWLGVKLTAYTPAENRPDWQQTVRDAKTQQRRRARY